MSVQFSTKRDWVDKIKLDGKKVIFDNSTVLGATATKETAKAYQTGDFDKLHNIMVLNGIISTSDGTNNSMVVGRRELYVLSDGKGQTRNVESDVMVTKLEQAGWKVVDVKFEDIIA